MDAVTENGSDLTKISVIHVSEGDKDVETHQNGRPVLVTGGPSSITSRRASFLIGEEKNEVPLTILGPDNTEITLDDIVVAPDGGWGWVVVFAAFMCNMIVDGTIFSFGIMQDEIVKSSSPIESERVAISTVAWVGSLLFGFTLLSGPFVSALANKFGFRIVGMTGSIISASTFVIAWAFSDKETGEANMAVMFIVYGIIGGIGFSLIYVPAVITVGFYFEKKRALATGIAICGSGCGTFIFAPLSAYFIKLFEWNYTLLIEAGVLFSCLIFASLYRPLLPVSSKSAKYRNTSSKNDLHGNDASTPQTTPLLMRIKRARDKDMEKWDSVNSINSRDTFNENIGQGPGKFEKLISEKNRRSSYSSLNASFSQENNRKLSIPGISQPPNLQVPTIRPQLSQGQVSLGEIEEEAEHEELNEKNLDDDLEERGKRQVTGESRISNRGRRISTTISIKDWDENNASFRKRKTSMTLMLSNSTLISTAEMSQSRILRINNKSILNKPLYRDDIFLAGSLQAVPEYAMSKGNVNVDDVFTSMSLQGEEERTGESSSDDDTKCKWNMDIVKKMLDFSLLKSPTFLLLSIAGSITLLGYSIPFIYLKALAVNNTVDPDKATLLVSIIGITNTIGRIICGGIADSPKVNSLIINNAALTIGGLATAIVPFIGNFGFGGYVTYACIFGFSMACFASLRSILLVELLGLSKLTNAFGLLLLFQGCAAMCGSPLAGLLFDLTGNFDVSFYVAGGLMLFSGVICYPLNSINNWENQRDKKKELNVDES